MTKIIAFIAIAIALVCLATKLNGVSKALAAQRSQGAAIIAEIN